MSHKTIIGYTDTALPTSAAAVTLYDSTAVSVPFHFLGLNFYQWGIAMGSAGDTATGVITGQYSNDRGVSWNTFYTSDTIEDDEAFFSDEVFVGMFKDVRFTLAVATEDLTSFVINQSLSCSGSNKSHHEDALFPVTPP